MPHPSTTGTLLSPRCALGLPTAREDPPANALQGQYPFAQNDGVVPCSDGAGTVEAVGEKVTRFKVGDKVATLFNQGHIAGSLDAHSVATGLGGAIDGCLREYGTFDEQGLVHMPSNLNYLEASTLTCAGLTAWNALYGLESRALKQGDTVLTQGTGGVSIFAVQVKTNRWSVERSGVRS